MTKELSPKIKSELVDDRMVFLYSIVHDLRAFIMHDLRAFLSLHFTYLTATRGTNREEFNKKTHPYFSSKSDEDKELMIYNYLKLGLLDSIYFKIDSFLSNIRRDIYKVQETYQENIQFLYKEGLISEEGKQDLTVLSYIRNSMHNNGIHNNNNNKDFSHKINETQYTFECGKKIECASWYHILNLFNALLSTIENILTLIIKKIEKIRDDFAEIYVSFAEISCTFFESDRVPF